MNALQAIHESLPSRDLYAQEYEDNCLSGGLDPLGSPREKIPKLELQQTDDSRILVSFICFMQQVTRKDCGYPAFHAPLESLTGWSRQQAEFSRRGIKQMEAA